MRKAQEASDEQKTPRLRWVRPRIEFRVDDKGRGHRVYNCPICLDEGIVLVPNSPAEEQERRRLAMRPWITPEGKPPTSVSCGQCGAAWPMVWRPAPVGEKTHKPLPGRVGEWRPAEACGSCGCDSRGQPGHSIAPMFFRSGDLRVCPRCRPDEAHLDLPGHTLSHAAWERLLAWSDARTAQIAWLGAREEQA